jgi:MFS family permease
MRFRFWLPLVQTVAMLLITWAPWAPESHRLHTVLRDGTEIRTWTVIPSANVIDPLDFAEGINLPAVAVVVPAEFAARRGEARMNLTFRFFGCWLVGLVCWYLAGRLLDDLFSWYRSGLLPRKHRVDLAFALLVLPSSALLAGVFLFGGEHTPILAVSSAVWLAASCLALAFRLLQIIRQRRRLPAS